MVQNLAQTLPDASSIASALLVLIWTCLCFFSILSQHKRKTLRLLIRGFIGSTALLVLSGYTLAHRFPNSHPLLYPLESHILAVSMGLLISGGVMKCYGSRKWLPLIVGILAAVVGLGVREFAIARGAISPSWGQSALTLGVAIAGFTTLAWPVLYWARERVAQSQEKVYEANTLFSSFVTLLYDTMAGRRILRWLADFSRAYYFDAEQQVPEKVSILERVEGPVSVVVGRFTSNDILYAYGLGIQGEIERSRGNCLRAKSLFFRAIDLYTRHEDEIGVAESYARKLAPLLESMEDYEGATEALMIARGIYARREDTLRVAFLDSALGSVYDRSGDFQNAHDAFQRSNEVYKQFGKHLLLERTAPNVGTALFKIKTFEGVLEFEDVPLRSFTDYRISRWVFKWGRRLTNLIGNKALLCELYRLECRKYLSYELYDLARTVLAEGRAVFFAPDDETRLAELDLELIRVDADEGFIRTAIERGLQLRDYFVSRGMQRQAADCELRLGMAYYYLSRWGEALKWLDSAEARIEQANEDIATDSEQEHAGCLSEILAPLKIDLYEGLFEGLRTWIHCFKIPIYVEMGLLQRALESTDRVDEYCQSMRNLRQSHIAYLNLHLGSALRLLKRHDDALRALEVALDFFLRIRARVKAAEVLMRCADLYMDSNYHASDCGKALQLYQLAKQQFDDKGAKVMAIQSTLGIASALYRLGQYAEAWETFQYGLYTSKTLGQLDAMHQSLYGLARICEVQSNNETALSYYEEAMYYLEQLRDEIETREAKMGFLGSREEIGKCTVLCSLDSSVRKPRRALEFVEQVKSRGLLDLLADSALTFPAGLATELTEQVDLLALTIRSDNIALDRASHDGERSRILSEIRSNRQNLDRLWKTIEGIEPEYVALRRGEPAKWEEIRALLHPA